MFLATSLPPLGDLTATTRGRENRFYYLTSPYDEPASVSLPSEPERDADVPVANKLVTALVGNLISFATIAYAALLSYRFDDLYYRSVQEDEYVEWSTFFAFVVAGIAFILAARAQRRAARGLPWFLAGVALFCFVVAGEEVSWGQRIFGYAPPDYFLANNFQQEFNVHNVVKLDRLRQHAVSTVLMGYGVVLPLIGLIPIVRRFMRRIWLHPPPWFVFPSFLLAFILWVAYPWNFSGEWVELMMGLGFLLTAVANLDELSTTRRSMGAPGILILSAILVAVLGIGAAVASDRLRSTDPALVSATQRELEALQQDASTVLYTCEGGRRMHKRLYSYVGRYPGRGHLLDGEFAALTEHELAANRLPESRARFFIDPWNYPYWVLCLRQPNGSRVVIYSFGPNRRRDSNDDELLGDDIGLSRDRIAPTFGLRPSSAAAAADDDEPE